ncbi:universal stress protein [Nocardioides sp. zg-DK7169]|uniref:universal stress protein n=1 Tax=Nocardioides sp. zg-DK7169 TaxID=2736600 RepID=UPI001552AEA0|nr:universal stress protein [Nocardioides sp. zg-DK7169]NPC96711.1 universal stress protein [Nocardioides sp. zg-DK7169]
MDRSLDPAHLRGSIVVAVDGSEDAERAVPWAVDQAALEGLRLAVVSAGEQSGELAERAAAAARRLDPQLTVVASAASGDPRQVLIDASAHAHLLVVGSRGRGTVRSMLLGSVSTAVSAHATCPVVVCRPANVGPTEAGVVVGADGTPESLPVLEFAFRQASLRDLPLTVLHSYWDATTALAQHDRGERGGDGGPDLADLRATLSSWMAEVATRYPDVPVSLLLKHGLADEALSPRDAGWCDMIVVGRHPKTSLQRLLTGSIATAVIERAHSTVAVVPVGPRSS